MKTTLIIALILVPLFGYSQNNCVRDTIRLENGNFYWIVDKDTSENTFCGLFKLFNDNNVLIEEGAYLITDSVLCNACYAIEQSDSNKVSTQYHYSKYIRALKINTWKYYHPNGKLKEQGKYCPQVHEYTSVGYPLEWDKTGWKGPVNVGVASEYLKEGVWQYFDEQGNCILTEVYVCGNLIEEIKRN